jgi:hypothetical protein
MASKSRASKSDPWMMVRLPRVLVEALRTWGRARNQTGVLDFAMRGVNSERDEPALWAIIDKLLEMDARKRARSRECQARKRERLKQNQTDGGSD